MSRQETKEPKDLTHLYTGFTKVKVIAINPDKELYEELNEESLDEEPKYNWVKDGVRKTAIDIYMKDIANRLFRHRIILEDKLETSQKGYKKFVNSVAEEQWAENEEGVWNNLKVFEKLTWKDKKIVNREFLGSKRIHQAKKGEVELLKYRMSILKASPHDPDTDVFIDLDPLFDGDYTELREDLGKGDEFHFTILVYVNSDYKQKVWKGFLPNQILAEINNGMQFSKYTLPIWNKWKENLNNEYSGIKGHYALGRIKQFDKSDIKAKKEISTDGPDY